MIDDAGPAFRRTALLLNAVLLTSGCYESPQPPSRTDEKPARVIAEPLRFEPARTHVEAVGTSRAQHSVQVYPAAAGEVIAVNFEAGSFVDKDAVLVELDSREEMLAVKLARVRLEDASRLYDRYRRSANNGAVTAIELDAASTQFEAARIELGRAQVAFDNRFVKAPIAGYVDVSDVDAGDRIGVDTLITTLDDRSSLLVSFDVAEVLVGELAIGDPVSLTARNRNEFQLSGTVVELGSRIDPANRTFAVRASVDNSADTLRPGMSFRVSIDIRGRAYAAIAETSVQWGAEGAYVWLVADDTVRSQPVEIVQRQQGRLLVDGELDPGDLVVVEGVQRVRNDSSVSYETLDVAEPSEDRSLAGMQCGGREETLR